MNREAASGQAREWRRWATLVLVLCSVGVGIVLSEVGYRIMRRFVCIGRPTAQVWRVDARYGWGHQPNGEGWWFGCLGRRFEWRAYTKINSHGFRDRERTYDTPAGMRRVLLLGDSMTEAMQVPLADTFATLVESELRGRGLPVEVLNAGVAGYGPDNTLLFFRAEGVRYGADVVVLMFNVMNDILESSAVLNRRSYAGNAALYLPKIYFHLSPDGALVPYAPDPILPVEKQPVSWWSQVENRVYLVRAFRRLVGRPAPLPVPVAVPSFDLTIYEVWKPTLDPEWAEAWKVTEALLRALRTDVERTGARFAVAVLPSREAVAPAAWERLKHAFSPLRVGYDPEHPVGRITAFLAREGIPHVSLLPSMRSAAERTGTTGFFGWDLHLDTQGHAVVAAALGPFVENLVTTSPDARH